MPRQLRTSLGAGMFHVTSRGNRRQSIFLADGDRRFFLSLLDRVSSQASWRVHGYCLLDTHYHLLLESTADGLSCGMQRLNGTYAQCFNGVHGFEGHLFQGRFYAGAVEAEGHLLELIRYLALNPVRAGLCSGPTAWAWSSYPGLLGLPPVESFLHVSRVLDLFSKHPNEARRILRRFVGEA